MKNLSKMSALLFLSVAMAASTVHAIEIKAEKVVGDLSKAPFDEALWKNVKSESVTMMGQPMAVPRPKETLTQKLMVQAIHDGQWVAFRLKWPAGQKAEAGKLGEFSDAVALQFPVKDGALPPVFMGAKDNPVHIFHWRAQYQKDVDFGKPEMKDIYPNMSIDMYPMEFKDAGTVPGLNAEKREVYSPGKAAGNPQSYRKESSVDEIFAEGFGSSSVIQNRISLAHGGWSNGEWSVVISRPLKRENGSVLSPGKDSFVAFAAWQGAKQEAGSRKSVTMSWVPLYLNP